MDQKLSHLGADHRPSMVDVSYKVPQKRVARARGHIALRPATLELISSHQMKKGNVLLTAELAGIQAAKKTSELIPLCHPLILSKIDVKAVADRAGILVESQVICTGQTGVEMEALTAVSVALLTIYDMCKAVDPEMKLGEIVLVEKTKEDLS